MLHYYSCTLHYITLHYSTLPLLQVHCNTTTTTTTTNTSTTTVITITTATTARTNQSFTNFFVQNRAFRFSLAWIIKCETKNEIRFCYLVQ